MFHQSPCSDLERLWHSVSLMKWSFKTRLNKTKYPVMTRKSSLSLLLSQLCSLDEHAIPKQLNVRRDAASQQKMKPCRRKRSLRQVVFSFLSGLMQKAMTPKQFHMSPDMLCHLPFASYITHDGTRGNSAGSFAKHNDLWSEKCQE